MNCLSKSNLLPCNVFFKISLACIVLLVIIISFSGCKTTTPQDSNMPWAQPAEWENKNILNKMGGASY
ncbi:MAG: hypothetical protein KAI43_05615 [Candidatus Aureabacteria bacterium]|nr:hypothetical protein [Candidatus Auribacterota bacterium]